MLAREMNEMKKLISILTLVLALAACAAETPVPTATPVPPTATPIPPTSTPVPPTSTPEPTVIPFEERRAFYLNCSGCHVLPDPQQHTAEKWPAVVERMMQNLVNEGRDVPNEATVEEIVRFLQRYALASE